MTNEDEEGMEWITRVRAAAPAMETLLRDLVAHAEKPFADDGGAADMEMLEDLVMRARPILASIDQEKAS